MYIWEQGRSACLKTTPSLGPFSCMYACGAASLLIEGVLWRIRKLLQSK